MELSNIEADVLVLSLQEFIGKTGADLAATAEPPRALPREQQLRRARELAASVREIAVAAELLTEVADVQLRELAARRAADPANRPLDAVLEGYASRRTLTALRNAGIHTVGQLLKLEERQELEDVHGVGPEAASQLRFALSMGAADHQDHEEATR